MESKYKRGIFRALDITANMIGVVACLIWFALSNNRFVNSFRSHGHSIKKEQVNELRLDRIVVPELGRKYLQSCR